MALIFTILARAARRRMNDNRHFEENASWRSFISANIERGSGSEADAEGSKGVGASPAGKDTVQSLFETARHVFLVVANRFPRKIDAVALGGELRELRGNHNAGGGGLGAAPSPGAAAASADGGGGGTDARAEEAWSRQAEEGAGHSQPGVPQDGEEQPLQGHNQVRREEEDPGQAKVPPDPGDEGERMAKYKADVPNAGSVNRYSPGATYEIDEFVFAWSKGALIEAKVLNSSRNDGKVVTREDSAKGDLKDTKYLVHFLGTKEEEWLTIRDMLKVGYDENKYFKKLNARLADFDEAWTPVKY
ncbi:hypothetical protein THAOC_32897 [Thalassiosira oceanica]|uniref:Chromo domain-containing protein n=1 Tax=Thalassiosira oceanica TaxID=159749 RepID=K0R516_THAOC|nr:hypothetical protein THAOC_32897 [Thalassiosira oceanica]|eukprot:EJK48318.1 hypothetical protein THAOC_32897 [Thalassiosira oceanica]